MNGPDESIPGDAPSAAEVLAALERQSTRHETDIDGGVMVWHAWGQGSAGQPPVVLLHGGSGSWTHWVRNIPALVAAGHRVWVPDLPGFGESSAPAVGHDADALPEPLEAGLRDLLGDSACSLVGFSFGGMVAGFVAERWPARVARLVVVGTPGLGIDPPGTIALRPWMLLRDEARRREAHRANLAALMLWNPLAVDELALTLHTANMDRDRLTRRRISRTDVLRRSLARVHCPLYAVYGAEDVLFRGRLEALAEALSDAADFRGLSIVPQAGHWVQYEQAAAFDAALAQALTGPPSP
jgi:pimeloyl-ACP methyl ester carboxylesterase